MMDHFADRLDVAVKEKGGFGVVGIDPRVERLPESVLAWYGVAGGDGVVDPSRSLEAIVDFSTRVIGVVAAHVPAVKINIAFFEPYRADGIAAYYRLVDEAQQQGLLVIGDVKRGDIGSTAEAYARAHLVEQEGGRCDGVGGGRCGERGGGAAVDAVTINAFAGDDGVRPFADVAASHGRGVFAWVRASNPSAGVLQDYANAEGVTFFEHLAEQVGRLSAEPCYLGENGMSCLGMVVGGTAPETAKALRSRYPHAIFLVPGYGAQGATGADCVRFARSDGRGVLVNASRSVIGAFASPRYRDRFGQEWEKAVEQACVDMKADLSRACDSAAE